MTKIAKIEAKEIAIKAIHYIEHSIRLNGKFVYERNLEGEPIKGKYNMLRHCGTIWAYNDAVNKLELEPKNEIVIAIEYLQSKFYRNNTNTDLICANKWFKLGLNALGILALENKSNRDTLLNGLAYFLGDQGTIKTHKFNKQGTSPFISEYYPGQAVLALATIGKTVQAYLIAYNLWETRDKNTSDMKQVQDHWLMQGLYILWQEAKEQRRNTMVSFYETYMNKIYKAILSNRYYLGRSCPMSCRVEALIPYYKLTKNVEVLKLMEYLLARIQIYQNQTKSHSAFGAFEDCKRYRIDYTQHALSAFTGFSSLEV